MPAGGSASIPLVLWPVRRCALCQDQGGRAMSRGDPGLREESPAQDQPREGEDGEPLPIQNTKRNCRHVPRAGEEQKVGSNHGDAVEGGGRHDRDAHVRAGLHRAVNQQLGRDEAQRARKAHARQSRQQEADSQGRRVLVKAVVVGQRKPAEARFQGSQRQAEPAQREDHREPQAERPGQRKLGVQLQPDQHQRGVAEKKVGEEPARVSRWITAIPAA